MSFFRELQNDLRTAAEDLRANGLNLDSLREEIGNEKRDPLPAPPPLKSATKTTVASSPAPKPVAAAEPPSQAPKPTSAAPQLQEEAPAVAPASSKSFPESSEAAAAAEKKPTKKGVSPAEKSLVGGLLTTAQTSGRELLTTAQTTTRRLAAQTGPDVAKLQRDLERTQQRYERCKAGLYRFEASAANGYAEYARAAEKLRSMVNRSSSERVELDKLRSMARRDAELAERAVIERDASTAELEAVALRQVDALQAEVASLRRDKRRAEILERSLEDARARLDEERRTETTSTNGASELRSVKMQLASARSGASAAARASRAALDAANERLEASSAQVADARAEILELKASLAKSHQDLVEALKKAPAAAVPSASQPRLGGRAASSRGARSDESDELRALLRQSVEEKNELRERLDASKRDLDILSELKATAEKKAESDVAGLRGELTAARRALRDARQAIIEGRSRDPLVNIFVEEPALGAKQASIDDVDDNHSTASSLSSMAPNGSGAYEYLRTVLKTALPAKATTPATRARLVPVLRSLLALPEETVEEALEALSRAHRGGDFALALLSHAQNNQSNSEKKIITSAEAAVEQGAVARRIEIARELEATKAELQNAKSENRQLDALSLEIMARLEATDEKYRELETSAEAARDAARNAAERQTEFDATLEILVDEQNRGLKPEQLEYLRGILLCFLKGASQPALRKQLLPVIANVLKFDPQDPRANEMTSLATRDA